MIPTRTALIAAVAENGVIGKDNDLPWKIPADMKFFKETTTGGGVIMGRKTFESLRMRPLPNRVNIVISRTLTEVPIGFTLAKDLAEGLWTARTCQVDAFVIGGKGLFKEAVDLVDRLYLTEIHRAYEGDVLFPEWDRRPWVETARSYLAGDPAISFVTLDRRECT